MIAEDLILKIELEINCRNQESNLEAAAALANVIHPMLKDLIATSGVDSQCVRDAADELAQSLIDIVRRSIDSGRANDKQVEQILDYVRHLPTSHDFDLSLQSQHKMPQTIRVTSDFDYPKEKKARVKGKFVVVVLVLMVIALVIGYVGYNYAQRRAADAQASLMEQHYDSLYREALALDNVAAWKRYQDEVPVDYLRDSSARIDSLVTLAWSQEPTAWVEAEVSASKDAYMRYLELYPDGEHVQDAQCRLVDIEVRSWRGRGNHAIESVDYVASLPGDSSEVHIYNKTDYDMEFLLSGPTSKLMPVKAGERSHVTIGNGYYEILIKVDNDRQERLTFGQQFDSAVYSSSLSLSL